ncbi:Metalloprotease [Dentipellis sp. KUC8613]|nr:Metalloprotease [Dentipellis sp. KUC8613]
MLDPTTQSNYLQIATTHVDFQWTLDFALHEIVGSASHTLLVKEDGVKQVIFDTADLSVEKVIVDGNTTSFVIGDKHPVMGSSLAIPFSQAAKSGSQVVVKIYYKTSKESTALQWLAKEQTQGGQYPYLFSQCQPIYARAVAPLQDTPSVKITYSAQVTSVLPVLLSAVRISPPSDGPAHDGKVVGEDLVTYTYNQLVPIPSYLVAIASGNLSYRPFATIEGKTWKSGVWAEPELIEASFWEFSEDTARFLAKEEEIVGPYRFGVYDLLVLPPSFPYGGMENACISFLTPTLLAGDRSLVDVVVHELTHSWFGNGVTHADATHFWLNEGWTTYIERLLQQFLHSPAERGFSFLVGSKSLHDALRLYNDKPKYQRLVIDFEPGEDPDDAYSTVPYEKGANFLLYIERKLGGLDVFLPYVKDYVDTFIGKSITTDQWKSHLFSYFEAHGGQEKINCLNEIDWNAWLFGEGERLPVEIEYDMSLAQPPYDLAASWNAARSVSDVKQLNFVETDVNEFSSNQKVVFLERLSSYEPLPSSHIAHLGSLYHLSTSANAEIRMRFYDIALQDSQSLAAKSFAEDAMKWVVGEDGTGVLKGRMKFCRTVFRAVDKVDHTLARRYFAKSRDAFHPIARKLIDKDLAPA